MYKNQAGLWPKVKPVLKLSLQQKCLKAACSLSTYGYYSVQTCILTPWSFNDSSPNI